VLGTRGFSWLTVIIVKWLDDVFTSAAGDLSDQASVTQIKPDSPPTSGRQRGSSFATKRASRQSKNLSLSQLAGLPGSPDSAALSQTPPLPSSTHIVRYCRSVHHASWELGWVAVSTSHTSVKLFYVRPRYYLDRWPLMGNMVLVFNQTSRLTHSSMVNGLNIMLVGTIRDIAMWPATSCTIDCSTLYSCDVQMTPAVYCW